MLTLLITSMLMLMLNFQQVKSEWTGTVYIRADGSIDPSDAPIITSDNITYTLIDNIASPGVGIVVERDNVTIDGAGHFLLGSGIGSGINLPSKSAVKIKDISIEGFEHGIHLDWSTNINITGNRIANNKVGIYSYQHFTGTICENEIIANNESGIYLIYPSTAFIFKNNIANNNGSGIESTGGRFVISENNVTDNKGVGIALYSSGYSEISYNDISNNSKGILLSWYSNNNNVFGNNLTDNWAGIWLEMSSYNILDNNYIGVKNKDFGVYGIYLNSGNYPGSCAYNNLSRNVITKILEVGGITLYYSSNNTIQQNTIIEGHGIWLWWGSDNNTIIQNNVNMTAPEGYFYHMEIISSSGNNIYHNNFVANKDQIYIYNSSNIWDNGYPSGGNFWSNYTGVDEFSGPDQDQPGSDGIGDTPYVIDANNTDRYPLMNPWVPGPSYKFVVGNSVWTIADLHVREGPGLSYALIDTMIKGNKGLVLDGPVEADGYVWWKINYSVDVVGWCAEDWLELVPLPPQPPQSFSYWAEAAIKWAEQRLGRSDWSGLCMRFVANAFMQEEGREAGYNAIDGAREFYRFNQEPNGWLQAPKGALIFFDREGGNEYGHVGICLGNGSIIHAYGAVKVDTVEEAIAKPDIGRYLGWSYPPETWRPTKFTFNATWEGVNYPVCVFTNSTVIDFSFDQPSATLSFTIGGESGMQGYCNVTIPKTLLKGEPWTLKLNGTDWSYIATRNTTHSFIYFTFTHGSTYEVTIQGTWVIPEFPSRIILALFMLTTLFATAVLKTKRKRQHT